MTMQELLNDLSDAYNASDKELGFRYFEHKYFVETLSKFNIRVESKFDRFNQFIPSTADIYRGEIRLFSLTCRSGLAELNFGLTIFLLGIYNMLPDISQS